MPDFLNQTVLTSPGQTSGRIYTQGTLEEICNISKEKEIPVTLIDNKFPEISSENVVGTFVNARVEDNAVVGDIKVFENTAAYKRLETAIKSGTSVSFACGGTGTQHDNVVFNYVPVAIQVYLK